MDEMYSGQPFFDLEIFLGTNTNINYKCQSHVITIRVPNISITTCSMNMNEIFLVNDTHKYHKHLELQWAQSSDNFHWNY